jgi:hypothetical protein
MADLSFKFDRGDLDAVRAEHLAQRRATLDDRWLRYVEVGHVTSRGRLRPLLIPSLSRPSGIRTYDDGSIELSFETVCELLRAIPPDPQEAA